MTEAQNATHRLSLLLERIEEIASEDPLSPQSIGIVPAVQLAREALKDLQQIEYQGSRFATLGSGVTIGCISPEARDLLDAAMAGWEQHRKQLPDDYQDSVYSFAYWLIRWSRLVKPNTEEPHP